MLRVANYFAVASGVAATTLTMAAQTTSAGGQTTKAVTAQIRTAKGADAGHAEFRHTPNGVLVRVQLHGLPAGTHAMHIHEFGMCDAPDFKSAGGHFAPGGREHGFLDVRGPHAGDLPNVHLGKSGETTLELFVRDLTLHEGPRALLDRDGSALVIHADADDYHDNPAGDAGGRIACGVVQAQK